MGKLDDILSHILGTDKQKFNQVQIDREVIDEIIQIARESYPLEFVALLQGKIEKNILHIYALIFLPGETSSEGAVMEILMLPPMSGAIGSVHSHPGLSNTPSQTDYMMFSKNGLFHMIISEPYDLDSIASYDTFGEKIDFKVI
ncbi:Mov34/MPN/PAD-1 family protein [Methanobacterium alcaliphilum]|uniref:Mov34/MPN/PAD-1 family protein n=1 Tax=Methanobacterium alcaliphilum TaxID=392018 RepID=UPI00200B40EE|nr:Mov34/MPN/PAD-1 family protein [Methanobacterium alcaliphilum]MCK9150333.1 Mov34/MPN/PAD-1 family protein [Methanobacterium alcaliphilum]